MLRKPRMPRLPRNVLKRNDCVPRLLLPNRCRGPGWLCNPSQAHGQLCALVFVILLIRYTVLRKSSPELELITGPAGVSRV